jgi:serine/threonine protein kinase
MSETEDYLPRDGDEQPGEDGRLVEAVREYQAALDEGRRPSRREFLSRYPDIAAELAECLDGLEFVRSAATRLRPAEGAAPPPAALPPEGTLGDFRLLREIGRGAMGVVYEAVQLSLGRRVALKVLPLAATLDARGLQRFENEARAAAHLHHGNIVPVFAVGQERGVHYYAMQLIDGRTLAAVIEDLRRQPAPDAPAAPAADTVAGAASLTRQSVASKAFFRSVARIGAQAAEALEYAHQMGVVHRDVKPANLLLDSRNNLWVTDFGLARFQASPGVTSPGDLVGTLRYMSPEQAAGQPVIDPRSDVYSLGATLYELLTQQPACPARGRQECLRQVLEEEPAPPRRLNRAVPAELETIVLKALAKRPEDRYASAGELAEDLRRFLDDRPVQARRPGLPERAARWARRHRRLVAGAVLGLVAAVLVLGATTWRVSRAEARALAANDELKDEKARTAAALEQEVAQRARAESNYRQARKVLDFLTRLGVEEMAGKPELQGLRKRLLSELLAYYKEFIDQHGGDASAAAELNEAQVQVAELLDEMGRKAESLAALQAMRDCDGPGGGPRPPLAPFGGRCGPPRGPARVFLLGQPAVREELKLSPEQEKRLAAVLDFRGRPPTPEGFAAAEKAVDDVLSPAQAERLRQVVRQVRGPYALLDPEAAEALGLTARQREKIQSVLGRSFRGPPRREGPGGPGRRGRPPGPPGPDWKQVNAQALAVLEPEQLARWQAMLGEPFRGQIRFGPPRHHHPPPGR